MRPIILKTGQEGRDRSGLIGQAALLAGLSISMLTSSAMAQGEDARPPGNDPAPMQRSLPAEGQSDLQGLLLDEMSALANELEEQRRFNAILRDRVDILVHRIAELEELNSQQAARLDDLAEQQEMLSRRNFPPDAPDVIIPKEGAPHSIPPAPAAKAPQDLAKKKPSDGSNGSAPAEPTQEELMAEFERFLDMGEAMMRRFFGVVKEFRKEFDDNRV